MSKQAQIRVVLEYDPEMVDESQILEWECISLRPSNDGFNCTGWIYEHLEYERIEILVDDDKLEKGLYEILGTVHVEDTSSFNGESTEHDIRMWLDDTTKTKLGKDAEEHFLDKDTGDKWNNRHAQCINIEDNSGGNQLQIKQNEKQIEEGTISIKCGHCCVYAMEHVVPVTWLTGLINFASNLYHDNDPYMIKELLNGYGKEYSEELKKKFYKKDLW